MTDNGKVSPAGRIERFHGALRRELLSGATAVTLAAAQQVIDGWITECMTDRPHQASGRRTPAERSPYGLPTSASPSTTLSSD